MSKIIMISGRAGAGKDSAANTILGNILLNLGIIKGSYKITEEGKLWVSDLFGNKENECLIDLNRQFSEKTQDMLNTEIYPYIKLYSFAEPLKEFLMNVFGLSWESVNGSNEEKDKPTHILWDNLPENIVISHNKTGPMSGRELMEVFGTDICRNLYEDCWARATFKKIEKENPQIAIIKDCRASNEVFAGLDNDAIIIRLLRNPYNKQTTIETALDPQHFDYSLFHYIVDNSEFETVTELSLAVNDIIKDIFENKTESVVEEKKEV